MSEKSPPIEEGREYQVRIEKLEEHPFNLEIYGNEPLDQELVSSIFQDGLMHALTITDNNNVISGSRRLKALRHLQKEGKLEDETVKVIYNFFHSVEPDELDQRIKNFIVTSNVGRKKDQWQRTREGMAIEPGIKKDAATRQKSGKSNLTDNSTEGENKHRKSEVGETIEIIAKRVGLPNGRAYENNVAIIRDVDSLIDNEKPEIANQLLALAGRSKSSALKIISQKKYELLDDDVSISKRNAISAFSEEKDYLKRLKSAYQNLRKTMKSFLNDAKGDVNAHEKDLNGEEKDVLSFLAQKLKDELNSESKINTEKEGELKNATKEN